MLKSILSKLGKSFGGEETIKKSELLIGLNYLKSVMSETMRANSNNIISMLNDDIGNKSVSSQLRKKGLNVKNNKDLVKLLSNDYEVMNELLVGLIDLVEKHMVEVIIKDTVTFRQNAIIDLSRHIDTVTNFYSDLLLLIIYLMNDETKIIYKKKTADILTGLSNYEGLMSIYRNGVSKVLKDIENLSETRIIENKEILKEVASAHDMLFELPTNGFNGNPIFAIGKWWVDFQLSRADRLEAQKSLTELKIIQLKDRIDRGIEDTNLDEQIEIYEAKVQRIEKKVISLRGV